MVQAIDESMEGWDAAAARGEPFDVAHAFNRVTMNVLVRTMFGTGLAPGETERVASALLKDPGNPFLVTAMIGDAWSMFGEALSVFPPGYVPGKIISAMGSIVSGASDLLSTALTLRKTREEQRGLLRQTGVPERLIEGLVSGDVNALAERGKLNPHQVQAFLGGHSQLSQDRARRDALLTASEQFRMYNTNFQPFLERLAAERGTSVESIAQTLRSLIRQDGGDQNVRAYIRNNYPETAAWAEARAPRDR